MTWLLKRRLGFVSRVARRLWPYTIRHRNAVFAAAAATLGFIMLDLARPWVMKVVMDQVILGRPWELLPDWLTGDQHRARLLAVACLGLVVIAAVAGFLNYIRTLLLARVGQNVVADIRGDLYGQLVRLPLEFHDQQRSGDLLVRLTGDAAMMKDLLVEGVFTLTQELTRFLAIVIVMLFLHWQLSLLSVLVVPGITLLVVFYGRRLKHAARRQRAKEGKIASSVDESLAAIDVIQSFNLEGQATKRFARQSRKSLKAGLVAVRLEGAMTRWSELTMAGSTALVLFAGAHAVLRGTLSAGELLVLISYTRSLYKPLRGVVSRAARLLKSAAGGDRLLEILDAPLPELHVAPRPDAAAFGETAPFGGPSGRIEFCGVDFDFDDHRVLRGVDLEIPAGTHVALVGPNGAGKSTLLSLIPRLREPTSGQVRVDGVDVQRVDLNVLRARIAVVFQNTTLFDGTVLENVEFGAPGANREDVLAAAERAGVLQFAQLLPHGLETRVGEKGTALSGGQRQRVALARALLKDAPIVLLDEPAASLDPEAEALVTADLLGELSERTVIISAHRPETIAHVEDVVVLEDGRVSDRGLPVVVAARNDYFAKHFARSFLPTSPRHS